MSTMTLSSPDAGTASPDTGWLDSVIQPIEHFSEARRYGSAHTRLEAMRHAAGKFRDHMLERPQVRFYRSMELIRVPYPSKYAFLNCNVIPMPFIHILNRLFIVQVNTRDGVKTLLLSPSDIQANAQTPYFRKITDKAGPAKNWLKKFIAPEISTVNGCLQQLGLAPEDIDFISYDHLHTQDLRQWLGDGIRPGFFPNAKLLVMREEWESANALMAPQIDWYCPNGLAGVAEDRVIQLEGDVMIGDGLALIRTPGHTVGNHSFVAHTPEGLKVTSENGVGPDCYAPDKSRIPGLKKYAQQTGMEVILNGNTLEGGLDQYISMVVEKTIAGNHPTYSDFPNMANSSELTGYWGFPGYKPTVTYGDLHFGTLVNPR
ncbi:hypothetical protein MIB92_14890 [Aestuariirhabdus sp. Z084]|uniref:hypothetical protein n=1 Tax=Aestuariirhabdus haliotis TaxID=2918751 RepID=UPI00201B37C6|nr:hypothetical protein [Aestuariirhabdus haliotis]MCL6416946.1 hypothetical protein [Aestuariirhabdus haliotis]MCL6420951.1 hypothetical protein [Aestuariirhabdus haliotis]